MILSRRVLSHEDIPLTILIAIVVSNVKTAVAQTIFISSVAVACCQYVNRHEASDCVTSSA